MNLYLMFIIKSLCYTKKISPKHDPYTLIVHPLNWFLLSPSMTHSERLVPIDESVPQPIQLSFLSLLQDQTPYMSLRQCR